MGIGLYTVPEAAHLTAIPSRQIRRWLFGYQARISRTGEGRHYPGLWDSQLKPFGLDGLGFHDLLEIRFVHALRKHGVSLQAIRVASRRASEYFHQPYPFTCRRFLTDGRAIFAEVREQTGDETLLDLVKQQYVFRQIVRPGLYTGIEHDDDVAQRWYPVQNSRTIVLDPRRGFGKPILAEFGIPTATLHQSFEAEDRSPRRVARMFDVPTEAVEAAVRFEHRLAA